MVYCAENVPAFARMTPAAFFPCLDEYGQFRHREWPEKVHADADFAIQRAKEEKDLAAHPGPKGWDKWGGWADGPQQPKTGGFSTTKWNGKWWIVDPDGHLWWSHGPVRVTPSGATTALDGRLRHALLGDHRRHLAGWLRPVSDPGREGRLKKLKFPLARFGKVCYTTIVFNPTGSSFIG